MALSSVAVRLSLRLRWLTLCPSSSVSVMNSSSCWLFTHLKLCSTMPTVMPTCSPSLKNALSDGVKLGFIPAFRNTVNSPSLRPWVSAQKSTLAPRWVASFTVLISCCAGAFFCELMAMSSSLSQPRLNAPGLSSNT